MKKIHKYNKELVDILKKLDDNELSFWFTENTIEYEKTLNEVIQNDNVKPEFD